MGNENYAQASGGFMFKCSDDGEWQNLGYIGDSGISFAADSDDDELGKWHDMLLSLNKPVTFKIKFPWYMENEWYRIFTGRLKYTVPSLRRNRKGHPRGHER